MHTKHSTGSCHTCRLVSWLALMPLAYKPRTIFKACPVMGPQPSPPWLHSKRHRYAEAAAAATTAPFATPLATPTNLLLHPSTAQRLGGPREKQQQVMSGLLLLLLLLPMARGGGTGASKQHLLCHDNTPSMGFVRHSSAAVRCDDGSSNHTPETATHASNSWLGKVVM